MKFIQTLGIAALSLAASATFISSAVAQSFPSKPIRFIIGFPPGSILDNVARPVTLEVSKRLGQPIILEHKPGASATIAAKYVVNADPDGHTLLFTNPLTSHPVFTKTNAVDPTKELASVALFANVPWFIMIKGNVPARTFAELVAHAKSRTTPMRYGSPASSIELGMAILKSRTGFGPEGVPYKGTQPVLVAMLGDQVEVALAAYTGFGPHIQAGTLRAIMVMSSKRSFLLPDVPTAAEAGVPNMEMGSDYGLWAPLRTPPAVVQRLNSEIVAALNNPAVVDQIRKASGGDVVPGSAEAQLRTIESSIKFWSDGARAANYQPQ